LYLIGDRKDPGGSALPGRIQATWCIFEYFATRNLLNHQAVRHHQPHRRLELGDATDQDWFSSAGPIFLKSGIQDGTLGARELILPEVFCASCKALELISSSEGNQKAADPGDASVMNKLAF
jgi:hypothetical protein